MWLLKPGRFLEHSFWIPESVRAKKGTSPSGLLLKTKFPQQMKCLERWMDLAWIWSVHGSTKQRRLLAPFLFLHLPQNKTDLLQTPAGGSAKGQWLVVAPHFNNYHQIKLFSTTLQIFPRKMKTMHKLERLNEHERCARFSFPKHTAGWGLSSSLCALDLLSFGVHAPALSSLLTLHWCVAPISVTGWHVGVLVLQGCVPLNLTLRGAWKKNSMH